MLNIKNGSRFTDDSYSTQEDVKNAFNQEDISKVWGEVLTYRGFYDHETDLADINGNHYKLCLTRKLLSMSYNLQIALTNDLLLLSTLSSDSQRKFLIDRKVESLLATGKCNNINSNSSTLRKLACGEMESIPNALFALKAYSDAFDQNSSSESITLETIENINKVLSGEDVSSKASYRSSCEKDPINTLEIPETDKIPEHLNTLVSFLSDEEIPCVIRALSIIYFFFSVRPFEYYNEETAAILAKSFFSSKGMSVIGYTLDFESICYSHAESFFHRLKTVETSLDLTYFIFSSIVYLINEERTFRNIILDFKKKDANTETAEVQETSSSSITIQTEEDPLATVRALPSFPKTGGKEEADKLYLKLLEVYPQLKKKQAHFYANHCTIGLHYTIEQFKECEGTVYETARTSMEDLANKGFYQKQQMGKKFVYAPIPMKEDK